MGLWKPLEFIFDVGPGIYFREPYDPARIPVLFVHGIDGTPRNFESLVDQLDRTRFQAWFYYYPSGVGLPGLGRHLDKVVASLAAHHGVPRVFVVAHSMGGLVARSFILHHYDTRKRHEVELFVSISTPWNGHDAARRGVEYAPVVVYSWRDVATGSDFLRDLFWADAEATVRRRLPDEVPFHLFFGHHRAQWRPGTSGDGTVSVASQLRPEAQDEARAIRGFDAGHVNILQRPETAALLNAILAEAAN